MLSNPSYTFRVALAVAILSIVNGSNHLSAQVDPDLPHLVGVTSAEARLRVAMSLGQLAEAARHIDNLTSAIDDARKGMGDGKLEDLWHLRFQAEKEYAEIRQRAGAELARHAPLLDGFLFENRWFEGQRSAIAMAYFSLDTNHVSYQRPGLEAALVESVFGKSGQAPATRQSFPPSDQPVSATHRRWNGWLISALLGVVLIACLCLGFFYAWLSGPHDLSSLMPESSIPLDGSSSSDCLLSVDSLLDDSLDPYENFFYPFVRK
jgi:hypothetical protein